jgi:DNA-binding NarL/FixJ family response regulator
MIKLVVADASAIVRAELIALLDGQRGIEVVAEAADGDQAAESALRHRPDVVLIERDSLRDGLDVIRTIMSHSAPGKTRVILFGRFDTDESVFEAVKAGVAGLLVRHALSIDLVRAVRIVAGGGAVLSPEIAQRILAAFASLWVERSEPAVLTKLTRREREILVLLAEGLSNREIGKLLYISPDTARTHVGRIHAKLGIGDRSRLVAFAHEHGLARVRSARSAVAPD